MRIDDVDAILSLPGNPSEEEQVKLGTFKSLSRKNQQKKPPIMPGRFRQICPEAQPIKRWDKFWKNLYKEEWLKRNDFGAIHHFNFGSYVPIHDRESSEQEKCYLCLNQQLLNEMLSHIYNECAVSRFWWQRVGFTNEMNLREMLAPEDTSFDNLRKLNWFVKAVKLMYGKRRRTEAEGGQLSVFLIREMKKTIRQILPMGR